MLNTNTTTPNSPQITPSNAIQIDPYDLSTTQETIQGL